MFPFPDKAAVDHDPFLERRTILALQESCFMSLTPGGTTCNVKWWGFLSAPGLACRWRERVSRLPFPMPRWPSLKWWRSCWRRNDRYAKPCWVRSKVL